MSATHYPHGLGGSTGDSLVTNDNFYSTYIVLFVSSVLGDDDNLGLTRSQPKATLASAVTFANTQDHVLIVLMDGHGEVVTSTISMTSSMTIVGEGRDANGDPTVWLQSNMSSGVMLDMGDDLSQLRNVLIKEPLQARTSPEVQSDGAYYGVWLKHVKFLVGANSRGPALRFDSLLYPLVEFCEFVLTADAHEDSAAGCWSVEACEGLRARQTTMDNSGGFVWQRTALGVGTAYTEPAANTRIEFDQMRLLGSTLMGLHANTTGWVQCDEMTGEARVDWGGAPIRNYPNGLGCSSGPTLITNPNLYTTCRVWYVDSQTGNISNDGQSKDTAWATLEDEVGNLIDTDIVVFLDGHQETPSAEIDLGIWHLIGEGSSGGLPTVKFQDSVSLSYMFGLGVVTTSTGASIRNIQIVPQSGGGVS